MRFSIFCLYLLLLIPLSLRAQCVSNSDWTQIIPSAKLAQEAKFLDANNNLDLIKFKDTYYVGVRTAPNHFASKKTRMYVLSTQNFEDWNLELEVALGSDLREPRFYQNGDSLFFMFFKGGDKKFKFEPQGIYNCYLDESQSWSEPTLVDIPLGYVPWRVTQHNDLFYLSCYDGINEYKLDVASEFRFFVSSDGLTWHALSEEPQINHPRAIAEVETCFTENGDIWGIARLEFDGSYIVHASQDDYSQFEYWHSKYKFDSPLIFQDQGKIYLIARRNLDGPLVQKEGKYKNNLVRYSFTKKTTALYLLDTDNKTLIHIKDFASTGDCAFPGIAKVSDGEYVVLNYSSDIQKRAKSWIAGQLGKTFIYKSTLKIQDCETYINSSTSEFVYSFEKVE